GFFGECRCLELCGRGELRRRDGRTPATRIWLLVLGAGLRLSVNACTLYGHPRAIMPQPPQIERVVSPRREGTPALASEGSSRAETDPDAELDGVAVALPAVVEARRG